MVERRVRSRFVVCGLWFVVRVSERLRNFLECLERQMENFARKGVFCASVPTTVIIHIQTLSVRVFICIYKINFLLALNFHFSVSSAVFMDVLFIFPLCITHFITLFLFVLSTLYTYSSLPWKWEKLLSVLLNLLKPQAFPFSKLSSSEDKEDGVV